MGIQKRVSRSGAATSNGQPMARLVYKTTQTHPNWESQLELNDVPAFRCTGRSRKPQCVSELLSEPLFQLCSGAAW